MYYLKMYWGDEDGFIIAGYPTKDEAIAEFDKKAASIKYLIGKYANPRRRPDDQGYRRGRDYLLKWYAYATGDDAYEYETEYFGLKIVEENKTFEDVVREITQEIGHRQPKYIKNGRQIFELSTEKAVSPDPGGYCDCDCDCDGEHWSVTWPVVFPDKIVKLLKDIRDFCKEIGVNITDVRTITEESSRTIPIEGEEIEKWRENAWDVCRAAYQNHSEKLWSIVLTDDYVVTITE